MTCMDRPASWAPLPKALYLLGLKATDSYRDLASTLGMAYPNPAWGLDSCLFMEIDR